MPLKKGSRMGRIFQYFAMISFVWKFLLPFVVAGCAVQPDPLTPGEVQRRVQVDKGRLFAGQTPVNVPIGLYEALARAIKYNLERRVKRMEEAVSMGELDTAHRDMLPYLAASAGFTARDSDPSSTSKGSNAASVSQEKGQATADLTMVWNVLDFGVSYVQAQQQADRVLIAREQRRKSTQNIIQEVRLAYWRASIADLLLPAMEALLKETEEALDRSRRMEREGVQDPLKALDYQQALLETTRHLWGLHRELILARSELAALMNLKPGTLFRIRAADAEILDRSVLDLPVDLLENYALMHRPELREEDYQERIGALEVRKVLLGALPGLEVTGLLQHDSNKYLFSQSWASAGMQLSWNLFRWVSTPAAVAATRLLKHLARTRRLAFSMAVLTQLHLALQGYHLANRELSIGQQLSQVHDRKLRHVKAARAAAEGNEMNEVRSRAESLFARMRQGMAFAEQQASLGRIHLSLGIDPLPPLPGMDYTDLHTMAEIIASRQHSVTSAIISEIPPPALMLPVGLHPAMVTETDSGSLFSPETANFWSKVESFSRALVHHTHPLASPPPPPMVMGPQPVIHTGPAVSLPPPSPPSFLMMPSPQVQPPTMSQSPVVEPEPLPESSLAMEDGESVGVIGK